MVYMYHSFLIHSSADGHLGCFHVLAMINSAAMNIGVHMSLSDLVSLVCMWKSILKQSHVPSLFCLNPCYGSCFIRSKIQSTLARSSEPFMNCFHPSQLQFPPSLPTTWLPRCSWKLSSALGLRTLAFAPITLGTVFPNDHHQAHSLSL